MDSDRSKEKIMTVEEIERVIEQMLGIQRNLQEGQVRLQESQIKDRQDIEQMLGIQRNLQEGQIRNRQDIELLIEQSKRQERIMERLIGYSISLESDKLDLEQRLNQLERRVRNIEGL
jgi:hypothetical protein